MFPYWDTWNRDHIAQHDVDQDEAEYVVLHAASPYPEKIGDSKERVCGQTPEGRFLQIIYVYWPVERVDLRNVPFERRLELENEEEVIYVIHARELETHEKRRLKRRRS